MRVRGWCLLVVLALMVGCSREAEPDVAKRPQNAVSFEPVTAAQLARDPELLHERLRATNPNYTGGALIAYQPELGLVGQVNVKTVTGLAGLQGIPFGALDLRGTPVSDIAPLKGMPLVMLGLEGTRVTDLSPIRDTKLKKLYLNDTGVADLAPLTGMPIEELMLVNTKVSDVSPLEGMPLKMLWLNNTQVTNILPIAACPLVSLTLEGTPVSDLSPLAGHQTIERLHIGGSRVTDLRPLEGLSLTRLIFTPSSITNGLNVARSMSSLKEIGTTLAGRSPPERFWQMIDNRTD